MLRVSTVFYTVVTNVVGTTGVLASSQGLTLGLMMTSESSALCLTHSSVLRIESETDISEAPLGSNPSVLGSYNDTHIDSTNR